MNNDRAFISLYFKDGASKNRKKGYITVSFIRTSSFYKRCKELGSPKLKELISVKSYATLVKRARAEERTVGNYIKALLKKKLKIKK